jgi:hypothetical protein
LTPQSSAVITILTYQLSTGYVGFGGSGYTLNQNVSRASLSYMELDQLTVRGTMNVYELLVHQFAPPAAASS